MMFAQFVIWSSLILTWSCGLKKEGLSVEEALLHKKQLKSNKKKKPLLKQNDDDHEESKLDGEASDLESADNQASISNGSSKVSNGSDKGAISDDNKERQHGLSENNSLDNDDGKLSEEIETKSDQNITIIETTDDEENDGVDNTDDEMMEIGGQNSADSSEAIEEIDGNLDENENNNNEENSSNIDTMDTGIVFELPDLEGETISISSVLFNDRAILIHFFSIFCISCFEETIEIQKSYVPNEKVKANFTIIGISIGEFIADVKVWKDEFPLPITYKILVDQESQLFEEMGGLQYPLFVLLNSKHQDIARFNQLPSLDEILEKLGVPE